MRGKEQLHDSKSRFRADGREHVGISRDLFDVLLCQDICHSSIIAEVANLRQAAAETSQKGNPTKVDSSLPVRAKGSPVFRWRRLFGILRLPFHMDAKARKPEFVKLERDLDKTLSKLKKTRDPNVRRELLREMRLLLMEADRMLDSPAQP